MDKKTNQQKTNDQENIKEINEEDLANVAGGGDVTVGAGENYTVEGKIGTLTGDAGSVINFG